MKRGLQAAAVTTAIASAEAFRRKAKSNGLSLASEGGAGDEHSGKLAADRALAVTVNCPIESVRPLPEPLAALQDRAEVIVRPARGGRGTEIAVRLAQPPPGGLGSVVSRVAGTDPRQDVRLALRQAKSLIETGEVLKPDSPPTTHSTLLGKPLEAAVRRSRKEGRL